MISTLLLLAASSVLQAGKTDAPRKAPLTFNSKEGGFSVVLPVKPTEAIREDAIAAGPIVTKIFQAGDGKSTFFVICSDLPADIPPDQVDKELDGVRTGYITSTNGKLVEEKKIKFEELPGREVKIDLGQATQRSYYFLRGERIYQLMVVQAKANDDPNAFRRFVGSFRLRKAVGGLKEAPVAEAEVEEYHSVEGGFRVRMAGKPTDQLQTIQTPIGPVQIRTCISQSGPGEQLMVVSSPIPGGTNGRAPDAVLEGSVNGAVANQPGSKLIGQKPIKLGEIPGREAEIQLPPNALAQDLTFFVHYYLAKDRLFQVVYIGPKAKVATKPVTAFLDSFRLDAPAATEPAKGARP